MNPPPVNAQQPALSDALGLGIPGRLAFDDDPIEAMLYGTELVAPTPASVLELWVQKLDRSEACARAVAAVLVQCPEAVHKFNDLGAAEDCLRQAIKLKPEKDAASIAACWCALGRIQELRNKNEDAEGSYRRALELQTTAPGPYPDTAKSIATRLVGLLEKSDRKEEAKQLHNRLKAESLGAREDEASLVQLRSVALEMLLAGQYSEAESAYRKLREKRFELPSTHCHLARVFLMMDRDANARREVEQARAAHTAPPAYLLLRIPFLQTLLEMLSDREWKGSLLEFKAALSNPSAHLDWAMQPVLDHLKLRLGPEKFELLSAMAAAACERSKVPSLEANPLWLEICSADKAVETTTHEKSLTATPVP